MPSIHLGITQENKVLCTEMNCNSDCVPGQMTEKVVERRYVLKASLESQKSLVYRLRIQSFPLLLLCFIALRYSNSRFHFTADN